MPDGGSPTDLTEFELVWRLTADSSCGQGTSHLHQPVLHTVNSRGGGRDGVTMSRRGGWGWGWGWGKGKGIHMNCALAVGLSGGLWSS